MSELKKFSDKETEELYAMVQLYCKQAKPVIIFAEEADLDSRLNLQIIKELRDAFDHTMRVLNAKFDGKEESAEAYNTENLSKAFGHIYRAAFDALDGSVLSLKQKICEALDSHDITIIKEVIPNYWELKKKIEEISNKVATHRELKDVGKETKALLENYVNDANDLKTIYGQILNSMKAIEECKKRRDKENKQARRMALSEKLIIIVLTVFVTALIGGLITTKIFFPWQKHIEQDMAKPTTSQIAPQGK